MDPKALAIVFALLTGLFWGTYGPTLANCRKAEKNAFKPYLMIGLAYLVWGVAGGVIGIISTAPAGQSIVTSFTYSTRGMGWGFAAGTLGAFGALTLTLAMYVTRTDPIPQVVLPIVFGTAVAVSAIASVVITGEKPNMALILGIIGMAVCIVIVASNAPAEHTPPPKGGPALSTQPKPHT